MRKVLKFGNELWSWKQKGEKYESTILSWSWKCGWDVRYVETFSAIPSKELESGVKCYI